MKKIVYYILSSLIITTIISLSSIAQTPVGAWKEHLPLNNGKKIALSNDYVYMLSKEGLMKYNKISGEVETLSKTSGLSDVKANEIAYNKKHNCLIIGYENGNIDLIKDNLIININDIKRKSISGDKNIYSIYTKDDFAYIGCGFGVVVLNLLHTEIKETWFIGEKGKFVKINFIDIYNGNVFLATDLGVYKGSLSAHLPDFSNWQIITKENLPTNFQWLKDGSFNLVKCFNDKLIINHYYQGGHGNDSVLVYDKGNWSFLDQEKTKINAICGNDDLLLICTDYGIICYDKDLKEGQTISTYVTESKNLPSDPNWVEIETKEKLWIADSKVGLIECINIWKSTNININGPISSYCFNISTNNNSLIVAAGGYSKTSTNLWEKTMYYKYSNYEWKNFTKSEIPELGDYTDAVKIIIDPQDETRYFCSVWNYGIIEIRKDAFYKLHNNKNSTLELHLGTDSYHRIPDICFDNNGNLWAIERFSTPGIHTLTKSNKWVAFDLPKSINLEAVALKKIITTKDNIKWITTANSDDIIVLDDNGTPEDKSDDRIRTLKFMNDEGKTISKNIYSIKEDLKGNIWIGCDNGVAVYFNATNVFKKENFFAKQIKIPRNNGTNQADLLLSAETVTAIEVDGANRKWFGTEHGGAYCTSEDGLEEIHHFTTENSPILSNNILSIAILPEFGEVFFGTNAGIISYGGTASQGRENYNNVYAYPNPVRPDYYGPITIVGLLENSTVKITDISGNLIYEAISNGGSAIWDGKNINGEKVKTGVYLVLASDEKGTKKIATKILFINSK